MGQTLRVLPDAERVAEAMVAAAADGNGFVDGSGFVTFMQLVDRIGGAQHMGRRPCSPLTARVVLWSAAREIGPGPFGTFVHEPAFARAAVDVLFDLKAGCVTPNA